ncbi:MAG TPA: hypothetical protein VNL15_07740 [Dehalococcoidia bacterium]|nr:hypothetical protein [Dehalococcoidia bacterium]
MRLLRGLLMGLGLGFLVSRFAAGKKESEQPEEAGPVESEELKFETGPIISRARRIAGAVKAEVRHAWQEAQAAAEEKEEEMEAEFREYKRGEKPFGRKRRLLPWRR